MIECIHDGLKIFVRQCDVAHPTAISGDRRLDAAKRRAALIRSVYAAVATCAAADIGAAVSGVLRVTIWRNTGDKGTWYSVVPARSYRNGDETWKETDSLGFDDLLTMAKLFDLAHTWIMYQQQADARARKESEQAAA